jgi:hypothetical protein
MDKRADTMTEATWGDEAGTPKIDWRMSAALQNVPRGDADVAEVTSLEGAVRAWLELDPEHKDNAVLTPEHPVLMDGTSHPTFAAEGIAQLAQLLPGAAPQAANG